MVKANDTGKNFKPLSLAQAIVKRLQVHRLSHGPKAQLISFDANSGLYVVGEEPIRLEAQPWRLLTHLLRLTRPQELHLPIAVGHATSALTP